MLNPLNLRVMKKISLILAIFGVAALLFTSCEKTTEDVSRITIYPTFEMAGDAVMFHKLGEPFNDPGATATEGGKDLPITISVSGRHAFAGGDAIDVNTADEQTISYLATNSDGFAGSVSRTVHVAATGDLVNSLEGIYMADIVRNGDADPTYFGLGYLYIWKNQDGTFQVSNGIGGYYSLGRQYGDNYKASGMVITANDISANDFTFTTFGVGAFGGTIEIKSMTVDASAKTIDYVAEWSFGYTFEITLTQVPF